MEVRNSAAESQSSDQSQPIQETEGDDGSKMACGSVDVLGGGVEVELGGGGGGGELVKKKRGRPPRVQAKSPPTKMYKEDDEDVCFICFDGGSLVLCDRRGCPKAYHPACVKRDDAFFQSTARWNCGWHICSVCQKAAHHMCYTCTYSLCKGCLKKADYVCVRGDKGFCTVCMKTIMLIENNGEAKEEKGQVDFDDKTSWEYLFKVYWIYLKGKLSLTLDELTQAKNPWKEANATALVTPSTCLHNGENDLKTIKRRKTDEHVSIIPYKETVITKKTDPRDSKDWATKELLDFVGHMKNGDTSLLSQFDVQELMLEYIKRNNLRDPRKKSQIICDSRLNILFGKPRVGHFEMLKLLEFHFFIKEDLPKNNGISRQVDPDWNGDNMVAIGKDKKRRNHKKVEERVPQNKLDEYAAIDVHNMNLIYLRRKLMENLVGNSEEFRGKVVGSIVRIRISGSDQKHDMYRLVQVVGTSKADKLYKIGDKSVNIVLEVLNLDKKETISIETISNQDLSVDECRRLRQSIKCGLVKRFTVGEIQDKAVSLQSVRLNDLLEAETLRLNNLRDRASEKGHKKSLREYVEKLQLLKTPEERERRLREIPVVHSDPKMNPDYESDDTEEYFNKEHEHMKQKHSGVIRKVTNSPKKPEFFNNIGSTKARVRPQPSKHVTEEGLTKGHGSSVPVRPQNQTDCNGSNHRTTASNDSDMDKVWHYRDPNGKVQGPFCKIQLQKWSTTGYFPVDMRIWRENVDESLLLNDVLKEESHDFKDKGVIGIEGLTVWIPKSTESTEPELASPTPVENNKIIRIEGAKPSFTVSISKSILKSTESTEPELASPTPVENNVKNGSLVFDISNVDLVELPSPTPKTRDEVAGIETQDANWSNGGDLVAEVGGDHGGLPQWQGVRETIEFSTLAEESVSDLLAEVDAMEKSQNGFPSPTSRRNNFVEDLFNGSFEEFSPTPTPEHGGKIHSPFQSTTTTTTATAATFKWPDMPQETISKDTIDVNKGERETDIRRPSPPPPPLPLTTRVNPHFVNIGWDPHQRARERSYKVEELGYNRNGKPSWGRQGSFGGGTGGGGGYVRVPPKGQRVCKFYESGRCKKGALCNYWHP